MNLRNVRFFFVAAISAAVSWVCGYHGERVYVCKIDKKIVTFLYTENAWNHSEHNSLD